MTVVYFELGVLAVVVLVGVVEFVYLWRKY